MGDIWRLRTCLGDNSVVQTLILNSIRHVPISLYPNALDTLLVMSLLSEAIMEHCQRYHAQLIVRRQYLSEPGLILTLHNLVSTVAASDGT